MPLYGVLPACDDTSFVTVPARATRDGRTFHTPVAILRRYLPSTHDSSYHRLAHNVFDTGRPAILLHNVARFHMLNIFAL